jgi:hypothetical protein
MPRVLIKTMAGLLAVAAAGAAALIVYWTIDEYSFSRRSPLAENLPANFMEASSVFQKRIIERFPVGSSAEQLLKVLSEQGFRRNPGYGDSVSFEQGMTPAQFGERLTLTPGPGLSFPCRLVWNVTWKSNGDGQITAVYAEYHGVCV